MKKLIILIICSLLFVACGTEKSETEKAYDARIEKIHNWQGREQIVQRDIPEYITDLKTISETGLTAHDILMARQPVTLIADAGGDYWKTSDEVKDVMQGDCEDVVFYWYSVFREEQVFSDHAMFFRWVIHKNGTGHMILVIKCYGIQDQEYYESEVYIDNGVMLWYVDYPTIVHEFDLWTIWR